VRVRYHPAVPAIALVAGVLFIVIDLLALLRGDDLDFTMIVGPLFILLGVQQLTNHYFDYDPATMTIAVKPVIGRPRPYGGATGGRLYIAGSQIRCVLPDGRTRKVPVSAVFSRKQDWHAVMAALNQQTAAGPAAP
jgi:hypothetical protein